jgi:sulfoxide reductase heme-binding subunit YedZ
MPAPPRPGRSLPWLAPGVFVGALVPLAALVARAAGGTLGAEPVAIALNRLGLLALIFLVASLACTPLKVVTGATWPVRLRRMLGLFGFFYAALHFLTYAAIDQGVDLRAIAADIAKRKFILVGFAALVLLAPLAATSTAAMVRRLGYARWKALHRLAYVAAGLGVVHFFLRVKKDVSEPAVYGAVLAVLFLVRIGAYLRRGAPARAPRAAAAPHAR